MINSPHSKEKCLCPCHYGGEIACCSCAITPPQKQHKRKEWRPSGRNIYIADIDGCCKCYKHNRIWLEGADFKLGRRPKYKLGGACKECVLLAEKAKYKLNNIL